MANKDDLLWKRQCVKVLVEVNAGDTLGLPEDSDDTAQTMRKFELSGNLYPEALIDRMIADKLLRADDELGVAMAAAGPRFLTQYR